jgi:nitroreductase
MSLRTAHPRVLPLFVDRWSPRAFDGTPLPAEDLAVILEAAALAPSAFNYQPWRFLYAIHGDANWDRFLSLLLPFNAAWASQAGALLFVVSDTVLRGGDADKPFASHAFDAGAAWALLALQATALGYHAHGMAGIDYDKARIELALPESYHLNMAVAIGRKGDPESLPEALRAREVPSPRKPVTAFSAAGTFADLPVA